MGNEACGCRRGNGYNTQTSIVFKPTGIQKEWSDAVKNNTVAAIEALHLQNRDRELLDLPIDTHNFCAIHFAAQHKKYKLLDYLLENHFDINRQETKYGNTALHFAARNEDTNAIEKLFSYHDIDDKIKNYNEGKEPCHMFPDHFKREYIKAKERGKALGNKIRKDMKHKTGFGMTVYPYEYATERIEYLSRNNGYKAYHVLQLNGRYRAKGQYLTKFALENGVDLDEMGMYLERNANKGIWDQLTNKKQHIKKDGDMERMLVGICKLTMRDKHKDQDGMKYGDKEYNERPTKESIQQLNKSMCDLIRQDNGKIVLSRTEFDENLHHYLYNIHQQIMNETDAYYNV